MAVKMEDRLIASSREIECPAFFSNTCLKSWRTAHNHTNINIPPLFGLGPKYFCSKMITTGLRTKVASIIDDMYEIAVQVTS